MSFQDQAQNHISALDKELSKYPFIVNLERQTSVPKVYAVVGLVGVYFFLIVFNVGGALLTNLAGFVIPGYYSMEALFSSGKADDTQWLTYWVVFAFLTVLESAIHIVHYFPFFYAFKFVFTLWLALPQTGGAQILFRSLLEPVFARYFNSTSTGSTSANLRAKADSATAAKTQ